MKNLSKTMFLMYAPGVCLEFFLRTNMWLHGLANNGMPSPSDVLDVGQFFGCAHRNMVCVRAFIKVSA